MSQLSTFKCHIKTWIFFLRNRCFKIKLFEFGKIKERSTMNCTTFRIGKGVLYREFHIRSSELSDDTSINKFNHRVDHALPMKDRTYFFIRHRKKMMCFNYFKSFIHHRRTINRDLLSHRPVWMSQNIFDSNMLHHLFTIVSESSS
jgi:hypothetical protein